MLKNQIGQNEKFLLLLPVFKSHFSVTNINSSLYILPENFMCAYTSLYGNVLFYTFLPCQNSP